jgi:hypothetical protein
MEWSICTCRQRHICRDRDVARGRAIAPLRWTLQRILILWTWLTRLGRGDAESDSGFQVGITFAQIGLVAVPSTALDVLMLKAGRRPAMVNGVLDLILPFRLLRPEAGVLGRQAEHGGSVGIGVVFKILERRVQGRMVVEDVV